MEPPGDATRARTAESSWNVDRFFSGGLFKLGFCPYAPCFQIISWCNTPPPPTPVPFFSNSGPYCSASFHKKCYLLILGRFRTLLKVTWQRFMELGGTLRTLGVWIWFYRCFMRLFYLQDSVLLVKARHLSSQPLSPCRKWTRSVTLNIRFFLSEYVFVLVLLTAITRGPTKPIRSEYQGMRSFVLRVPRHFLSLIIGRQRIRWRTRHFYMRLLCC